mmetsp:Transcript_3057/g.4460  ORF Transcript_3057/g.4460 Transcript_3057/m.4460 type:complete len:88 (-) Transcript_3057:306-569(-)
MRKRINRVLGSRHCSLVALSSLPVWDILLDVSMCRIFVTALDTECDIISVFERESRLSLEVWKLLDFTLAEDTAQEKLKSSSSTTSS